MKNLVKSTLLALAMTASAVTAQADEEPLKVGFVYVGPIGDHGWSYQHHQGLLAIEEKFGDAVETTYVESVSEGPDSERVIRQLAASGHDLIFTTSFGFMDSTLKVAEQFPEVKFEHATGFRRSDNVATYSARFYEGRYISGVIAGHLSKSGQATYIGSFPVPEVVRGINAFTLGMRSVNPESEVNVIWVNSWYDPGKEADAAHAGIAQGSDVIVQHTDSPAPMQAAANEGVYAIGQASDMRAFGETAQVTAVVNNWSPYYVERVSAALNQTWKSGDTWNGIQQGMIQMAPYTNMPYEIAQAAKQVEDQVRLGVVNIFAGQLNDQSGKTRIVSGETLSDEALFSMDWFVEGVQANLP